MFCVDRFEFFIDKYFNIKFAWKIFQFTMFWWMHIKCFQNEVYISLIYLNFSLNTFVSLYRSNLVNFFLNLSTCLSQSQVEEAIYVQTWRNSPGTKSDLTPFFLESQIYLNPTWSVPTQPKIKYSEKQTWPTQLDIIWNPKWPEIE